MDDYKPTDQYVDPREYKAEQLHDFLRKIAQIESSGGTNMNHQTMQSGPHVGTHAIGQYGLMPLTAQDIDRQSGSNELQDMDKLAVQKKLEQDPELSNRLAETMASKLLNRNNSETASYKWLHGPAADPSPEELENSDRIRQFRVLSKKP